jgi:[ribosomal protein S5]-alanine N-acetyltransferase
MAPGTVADAFTMALIESDGDVAIMAATPAILDAEDRGGEEAAAALGVRPPDTWPPLYNGPETRNWMRSVLAKHPDDPGFGSWYVIGGGQLVGTAGYKGPPDEAGTVEIGYSIIEAAQRRGYASGAVRLLVARAFRDPRVSAVRAETLPVLLGSQAVLNRCGFALVGRREDPEDGEILMYAISR